jgi:ABC-type sugar transport system substrate-binding protein
MKPTMMAAATMTAATMAMVAMTAAAQAEQPAPPRLPFVKTLSNTTPLAFGMDAGQAAQALGQSLQYVRGRPGNEIYLTLRNLGGSGLVPYRNRLFLQFRHGRLAGWKEDYGENWMWE